MAASGAIISGSAHSLPAGVVRRVAAYLVDILIALALLVLVVLTLRSLRALGIWLPLPGTPEETWRAMGLRGRLLILFAFLLSGGPVYRIMMEASPWQATFGKRLFGVYVTNDSGRRISLAQSSGRWLARWCFDLFGGAFVSLITIAVTRRKKALHDFVAKTLVVRGPAPEGALELWRLAVALGIPFLWILGTFLVTL